MARIRSIKPEFWTAEQVMECSPIVRLLFIGMWNFCDDGGNHPASLKTLKAEVFPGDDITTADVEGMVSELIANDLIMAYESAGKGYWHVTGWHHQKIEKPNFKHPKPEIRQPVANQSPINRQPVAERSTPESSRVESSRVEGKGVEGSGVEGSGVESSVVDDPPSEPSTIPAKATRKGAICGLLRRAGMADAAPHYLTDETWAAILAKRTDEEIVEVAKAKMAARPGMRTGLKYIAPALIEDPAPMSINGPPTPRKTQYQINQAAIASSLFGPQSVASGPSEKLIEGEVVHDR